MRSEVKMRSEGQRGLAAATVDNMIDVVRAVMVVSGKKLIGRHARLTQLFYLRRRSAAYKTPQRCRKVKQKLKKRNASLFAQFQSQISFANPNQNIYDAYLGTHHNQLHESSPIKSHCLPIGRRGHGRGGRHNASRS